MSSTLLVVVLYLHFTGGIGSGSEEPINIKSSYTCESPDDVIIIEHRRGVFVPESIFYEVKCNG